MSAKDVGQRLTQARNARQVELVDAAKATRIRAHYLRALEEGEFGDLPSPAQVRGFLRTYARYLGLEPQELFDLLQPTPEAAELPMDAPTTEKELEGDYELPLVFSELGEELRKRRESLNLTAAEIEEHTHIPEHYVQRLEQGNYDSFPSPTQARGMLGNYADFLGLDSNRLLGRYAEALQRRFKAKQAAKQPQSRAAGKPKLVFRLPPWLSVIFSRDILFGGLAGLVLLMFVVWSIGRIAAARASEGPQPTAPPLTGLLLNTPLAGSSPTGQPGTPGSINLLEGQSPTPGLLGEATIQAGVSGAVQLRLVSLQRTWMRVTVDGAVAFEGRTLVNQTYNFVATGQILLLTGNGQALRGFLNEQDLGFLGVYGEVVNIVFTSAGAATPTLSPTPTFDPGLLTATADAALTPSATSTPTPPPSPEPTTTASPQPNP
jgi:cytoskeletal protein RodZ